MRHVLHNHLRQRLRGGGLLLTAILVSLGTDIRAQGINIHVASGAQAKSVGVYHWGGRHTRGFSSGLREVVGLNGRIARITVSPRMNVDYNRGSTCIPDFTLSGALDEPDLLNAIAEPLLETIVITAYDGVGYEGCGIPLHLIPTFYSAANMERMVQEYSDFAYRLSSRFAGTGKRFILSNWEGDNSMYCGEAHRYAVSEDFRRQCLEQYPALYGGNRDPRDSIDGMVLWLNARYRVVRIGRQRALAEGLAGVEVLLAAEFCAVRMLRDRGFESVLFDVLPKVAFDYASYSAYESLADRDPAAALMLDLDTIRRVTGTDQIIVGEVGFARSALAENQIAASQAAAEAALAWGVPYVILWNLYDQDETHNFGLFDLDGEVTPLGRFWKQVWADQQGFAQRLPGKPR